MTRRATRKRVPPKGGPTGVFVEYAEEPTRKHNAVSADDYGTAVDNLCMVPAESAGRRPALFTFHVPRKNSWTWRVNSAVFSLGSQCPHSGKMRSFESGMS